MHEHAHAGSIHLPSNGTRTHPPRQDWLTRLPLIQGAQDVGFWNTFKTSVEASFAEERKCVGGLCVDFLLRVLVWKVVLWAASSGTVGI